MFDQASECDFFWPTLGQLNPVIEDVVSNPVHMCVNTCAARLNLAILDGLFNMLESTCDNPVISLGSKYFTSKTKRSGTASLRKFLDRLGKSVVEIFTE